MKKLSKGKLRLDATTVRDLSTKDLTTVVGALPPKSWGDPLCHTGSGMSNCQNCWSWDGDHSCYC